MKSKLKIKLKELEERQKEVQKQYDGYDDHYTVRDQKYKIEKTLIILNSKIDVLRELLNGVVA